jgi:predicted transcriptional regulator
MSAYDYLISLQPHHTDRIRAGEKTVEFRRRTPPIPIGSRLWVYSKLPIKPAGAPDSLSQ